MALIELCILSLLSPQSPGTAPPTNLTATSPQQPVPADESPQDPRQRLVALEAGDTPAASQWLFELTAADDVEVAARAAFLLSQRDDEPSRDLLRRVIDGPIAEARLQAVRRLCAVDDKDAYAVAMHALQDVDHRVRTIAAQTLGALRRPAAAEQLVGMIEDTAGVVHEGAGTDVQAALLALADIGSDQGLLRVATAIHDGKIVGTGNMLAYAMQTLSPKLGDNEVSVLCSVLAHREAAVRRYAISRLAEVGDKKAIGALEGRLGQEDQQLRALVELALTQLRRDTEPAPNDTYDRAVANGQVLWLRVKTWWAQLQPLQQGVAAGMPVLLLVLLALWRRAAARRSLAAESLAAAAWVQPSDEYLEEQEDAEYEHETDGDYDDEPAAEHESTFDDEDAEAAELGEDYDASGWQDDDATQPSGREVEDELFR